MLHPSRDLCWAPGERVVLAGEGALAGVSLEAYLERAEGAPAVVLALTGNAGRAESMLGWSRALCEQGFGSLPVDVLALQYPGYGGSGGDAELRLLAPAAELAYEHAREVAGDRPVIVHGLSMGTVPSLHLARTLPPDERVAFVLERPPSLWSQTVWQHGWWNLWLLSLPVAWGLPDTVHSVDNAAAASAHPALFLIGRHDRTVPPEYSQDVADAYAGPHRVLDVDAGHSGPIHRGNAAGLAAAFAWLWACAAEGNAVEQLP